MRRKILKWTVITSCVALILFLALGVHLYYVTDNFYQDQRNAPQLQLGRIDFKQPIDSVQAAELQFKLKQVPGVQKTYFNIQDQILVYSFYNTEQDAATIFASFNNGNTVPAERYIVAEEDKMKGCPAMSDKTQSGLLMVYQKLFSIF
jgi:hypothetical protein